MTPPVIVDPLAKMREPFPAHQVSKLPKPTKSREEMEKIPKAKCAVCGNYHATSHVIHLDYVGHAALTDRLLDADPAWTWEPLAYDTDMLPKFDKSGGLWIRLTVGGVTRLGYGNAPAKTDPGAREKEVIGDALRNAAMRFGAALDLWHKGALHLDDADADEPEAQPMKATKPKNVETAAAAAPPEPTGAHAPVSEAFAMELWKEIHETGVSTAVAAQWIKQSYSVTATLQLTQAQAAEIRACVAKHGANFVLAGPSED